MWYWQDYGYDQKQAVCDIGKIMVMIKNKQYVVLARLWL